MIMSCPARYSNHTVQAALVCLVESASVDSFRGAGPEGRLGDRMTRQLVTLSRARVAEAAALVSRAERLHPGSALQALTHRTMLRETIAAELGIDRSRVGFTDELLDIVPVGVPPPRSTIVDLVSAAVKENLRHLRLVVRLATAADLAPREL